ncbi:ARF guanine-nucleotide exchange factor 2 [Wickerhamomyces ciferrii]|uniref:ARF guanine-nucleotide exchange factor 2 n=1 Tax=Wickerhamomyces ciferrii (strain ATCC 14091 / BCRC 22168 / CBS 111 / JCM 3599 / NBRC 0793 / NRRL Y-1031 F-60-10) TaxID=1206466 RepID=K0KFY0_WICCF|nr:ARF guanine-nucleotide exchange factor 2 [Wickerhamomyces ciferrii]CCH44065.1 ARF guanine-nucleotide exchange factor 2 [Wickerhamomyces ciferrii]
MPPSTDQPTSVLKTNAHIAIDPVTVVIKECLLISSSMRKTSKYSQSGVAAILGNGGSELFSEDNETARFGLGSNTNGPTNNSINDPLLSGFIQLRFMLNSAQDLQEIDSLTLLQPFLLVIKSSSTTGAITSLALDSLSKFLSYNIISSESKNLLFTLTHIISSLTHCRFEASEQSSDDAVLLKVLNLLETIINSELGDLLSDEVIYEVVQTSLSLACNKRRSEVLRKAAELSMYSVTVKIFGRLDAIEPEQHHHVVEETQDYTKNQLVESIGTNDDVGLSKKSFEVTNQGNKPFGLTAVKQFLGILISMIAPENQFKHTESTKVFAFSLISTAVEMTGDRFSSFPSLLHLVADPVFKHTLNIIQNVNSLPTLQAALQLFTTLALTLGDHLQPQIELTLITIFKATLPQDETKKKPAASGKSTPVELNQKSLSAKELLVEEISILWTRSPSFFINLFINYDCNFHRNDLTVSFISFLSQLSLPESALFTTENVPPICLEGIVSFVNKLYEHIKITDRDDLKEPHELFLKKQKKKEFIGATSIFNKKPKDGLKALEDKGFIKSATDLDEVATFFYEKSSRLDKKVLGEFLAKRDNVDVLKHFYSLFDFKGLRVDEALRIILKTFRLPGEAQQIERIVENFAGRYVECQNYGQFSSAVNEGAKEEDNDVNGDFTKEEKQSEDNIETSKASLEVIDVVSDEIQEPVEPDEDAVFVLSFSVIMLNTDLHNPNIKAHMTLEDYKKNLRGVYNKGDFPAWYLEKIYQSIHDKEIVMPEEHHGSSQWFDDSWNNLIAANISVTDEFFAVEQFNVNEIAKFNEALFQSVFDSISDTVFKIFEIAVDDQIITKMMTTVDKLAQISSFYDLNAYLDRLVLKLAELTSLTEPAQPLDTSSRIKTTRIKVEGGESVTVSETSVAFGKDFKAQISTVVLFRVLGRDYQKLGAGIESVFKIISTLYQNGLIEPDLFPEFQSKYKLAKLPKIRPEVSLTRSSVTKGLFSTFASYLKGDDEPTDEQVENTLSTLDCIKSCGVDKLFENPNITSSNEFSILHSIIAALPQEHTPENENSFEPDVFFHLESALVLTLESNSSSQDISKLISYIEKVEANKENKRLNQSMRLRLLTYKLILFSGYTSSDTKPIHNTIDQITTVDRTLLEKKSAQILQPLFTLAHSGSSHSDSVLTYENFWKVLRNIASLSQYSNAVFIFIEGLLKSSPKSITSVNFMWLLGLLDEISSVGAIGGQWESEYDSLVKSGHVVDKENPYQEIVQLSLRSISLTALLIDIKDSLSKEETYALIQALAHQCVNPCHQIRSYALSSLEDTVLKIELTDQVTAGGIFDYGLIPLLNEDVPKRDILGTISKVYIHSYKLKKADNEIFLKILDIFNQYLEDPEIESELQTLISEKKSIDKENGIGGTETPVVSQEEFKSEDQAKEQVTKDELKANETAEEKENEENVEEQDATKLENDVE